MSRRSKEKKRRREENELLTRREIEAREAKRAKKLRLALVIAAIAALVAIVAVAVISIVIGVLNSKRINYETDDLSQYIYISRDDYVKYVAEITADAVDDVTIDSLLLRNIAKHRTSPAGASSRWFYPGVNTVLGVGDSVRIYYRGYTVDENGNKVAFDGGSNIYKYDGDNNIDETAEETYIGEGDFIDGFELGMVGKKPAEYSGLKLITDRATVSGDIISISCSITPPDAADAKRDVTLLVELTADAADSVYGLGFADRFIGKNPGDKVDSFATDDCYGIKGKTVFTDVKVNQIYDLGDNPMTVVARFPVDYQEETLAGRICYFDIYVKQYNDYSVPEIDEKFVTEELKLSIDEFNRYEGDTFYDKYRSMIKEECAENDSVAISSLVEKVMWETLKKKVSVKYIPRADINEYYEDYVYEVEYAFSNASSSGSVGNIDGYALTYLGLEPGDNWRDHLWSVATERVTEKLAFYYIVRQEGYIPTDAEASVKLEELIKEYIISYLEYYKKGTTVEDYKTVEEFNKEWAAAREEVLKVYDEAYFRENVIYAYGIEKLVELADLTVKRGPKFTPEQYTPFKLV